MTKNVENSIEDATICLLARIEKLAQHGTNPTYVSANEVWAAMVWENKIPEKEIELFLLKNKNFKSRFINGVIRFQLK